ncbi:rhamnulose-1-phosphate aldolase [uncultured Ellagibacter sp.]|uniref:rhamnulose-1-phosphate aldolase n=1 Tax=uncultured Ellagibacter sp. TaxID=2137580 RepID=UPI00262372B4|nr:rhamnulose-1-phosphate aldolase [uncultured Ellagibacter sp.]
MGFFDSAQGMLDKGVSAAKGAVSGLVVEQQAFMKGFVRMCGDGWEQGWHERNGGNLTYRMTDEEVTACRPYFYETPSEWVSMGVQADNLRGAFFTTTGSGRYMRNVPLDPAHNVGIVEINDAGDAWRIVWGLKDGGKPTSEFPSHFMNHSVRMKATGDACRVIYHAHPGNVIALTFVMPLDARTITRALWKAMTECIVVFPKGVGVVPWMVPGGADIAVATSELMKTYDAAIWAQHGLFCSGPDFDTTFGLMHTIEKAAEIYVKARLLNGGNDNFTNTITDDGLRAIARDFNLDINEDFLD